MESFDLTCKLVDLKIKSKAPDQIYFISQVFQEHRHCYDKVKNKKIKIRKIYLFLLPLLPSQNGEWEGGGVGGGLLQPPYPQRFSRQFFFIDTWVSGQRVGKLTKWQS